MNSAYFEFPQMVVASFSLACSACIAWLLLKWIKPSSHRIHRIVWFAVLLNCIFLVRFSVEVPLLNPDSPLAVSLLDQQDSQLTNLYADVVSRPAELETDQTDTVVPEFEDFLVWLYRDDTLIRCPFVNPTKICLNKRECRLANTWKNCGRSWFVRCTASPSVA